MVMVMRLFSNIIFLRKSVGKFSTEGGMVLNSCLLKSKFVLKIVDQLFILAGFNDIRESEIEHIMFVSILKMRIVISQIGQSLVLLKSIPNLVDRNFKEKTFHSSRSLVKQIYNL